MAKLVSIVMAVYKPNPEFFAKQLKSLNGQDYPNLELIVWNDYPGDALDEELIRAQVDRFPVYVHSDAINHGYVGAFETLTKLASRGEYIAYCDQDDVWLPQKVSACVEAIEEIGGVAAVCDRSLIDESGAVFCESVRGSSRKACDNWHSGDDITVQDAFFCYSPGMVLVARRDAAHRCLPFCLATGHDKWLLLGLSAQGKIAVVERPLVQYRRHGKNVTGTMKGIGCKRDYYEKRVAEGERVVAQFALQFPGDPHLEAMRRCSAARRDRDVLALVKCRALLPDLWVFEVCLALCPDFLFRLFLKVLERLAH